jgi:hypothetical protein
MIGQPEFTSQKMKVMFQLLNETGKNAILNQQTVFSYSINGNKTAIKCLYEDNKVGHIGLNIFSKEEMLSYPDDVYLFIEKTLFEFALIQDKNVVLKKMSEENVSLFYNGNPFGASMFTNLAQVLQMLADNPKKMIAKDSLSYFFTLSTSTQELILKFPARLTLLTYMDKKELDYEETSSIKNARYINILLPQINSEAPLPFKNDILICKGKSFHQGISSDFYIKKSETSFSLVYDKDYYIETLANQLLYGAKNNTKMLRIKHLMYGGEKQEFEVTLNNFVSFYRNNPFHELYFGVEREAKENIRVSLLIYNNYVNAIHILIVETNVDDLFDPTKSLICKFYSNIPTDNIKDLYGIYKEKR